MSVSIIVPFYNGEKYLSACLSSLAKSLPEDGELVLVNDGSTDSSAKICEIFTTAHPDVSVRMITHESCRGVSAARNSGLCAAQMPYVAFFDCDDVCRPQMHQKLLAALAQSDADLAYCGVENKSADLSKTLRSYPASRYREGSGREVALAFLQDKTHLVISSYIVRRRLIKTHSLRFTEGCPYGEDDEFTIKCLLHSHSVAVVREPLLYYRQSAHGVTAKLTLARFENPVAALRLAEYAEAAFPFDPELHLCFRRRYVPRTILNVFYTLAAANFPLQPMLAHMEKLGLTDCFKKAVSRRRDIRIMLALWRISPCVLHFIVRKRQEPLPFIRG